MGKQNPKKEKEYLSIPKGGSERKWKKKKKKKKERKKEIPPPDLLSISF